MANVKSKLKEPKSESMKKKKEPEFRLKGVVKKQVVCEQTKKTSMKGTKKRKIQIQFEEREDVVMKRESNQKVMTAAEKVKYILTNGPKLKEKFIARQSVFGRPKSPVPPIFYRKKRDTDLPLMTKSGRIKKKTKCNIKLMDTILKNELMINESGNTKNSKDTPRPLPPPFYPTLPLPIGEDNNNDNELRDQKSSFGDFSDDGSDSDYKPSGNMSDASDDFFEISNCIKLDTIEEVAKKKKRMKKRFDSKNKKARPQHIKLKNGVVLKLDYFECDHCKKSFNRKCSLQRHILMHLGVKPYSCSHCPQKFISLYNMQVHIERFHARTDDPGLYICHHCEKPFLKKEDWKTHIATHSNTAGTFPCIYCDEVFTHQILLMQHEKKHLVNGQHECTLCSMTYTKRNSFFMHIKSHLKLKDYVCHLCGNEFLRYDSMMRHVVVNHGGHRLVCPICNKSLKGHLNEHMRTHLKKQPHVCPDCGRRFTQATQMNVHRRSHSGAKPYVCRICKRFFSHSNALMLHIRTHTGEKPFTCALCPISFSQLPHMKTHMSRIHGKDDPYKCCNCNSFFKLKVQLEEHANTCTAGNVSFSIKGTNNFKDDEVDPEVQPMTVSRMRFLLALLFTMIATKEKLKYLGFNKRLVDEILVESLEAMEQTPCKDKTVPPAKRLRTNIEILLNKTVPKFEMVKFKEENKSTLDILELLTIDE